ncbi:sensor histidine kinase [Fredinandcohnia humi]
MRRKWDTKRLKRFGVLAIKSRNRKLVSILLKIAFHGLASVTLAILTAFLVYFVMSFLYYNLYLPLRFVYFLQRLENEVDVFILFILFTIVMTFIYHILLSVKNTYHFVTISESVEKIAEGNFHAQAPVKGNKELKALAKNINQMSEQMKNAITEEKKANYAKNELITNVSHDLRTPLTSIIGYLKLIDKDVYKDEVELRYYANIAFEKALRLNRMVDDLFEYTRVNQDKRILKLVEFNLVELLGQVISQFIPLLKENEMEASLNTTDDKILINADPDKLMRVFENIMTNAIKYGKTGRRIDITLVGNKTEVIIELKNYGPAIPSAALPHLFDRFYRVESSRSEETGGSGLGLAISKSIVSLHDGEIQVESSEKETVFEVKLPLSKKP